MANGITGFRFNGLGAGTCIFPMARVATGLDASARPWQRGTGSEADIEVTSTQGFPMPG